jgi:SpoVK/Ycf46/Vps4 family AAA+-type ATPase
LEKISGAPLTRVGSLSQMVLTVHDFVTAMDGFVPVSLRGLPLHTTGTMDFSNVGGLEKTKRALQETLLWPSKVRRWENQSG